MRDSMALNQSFFHGWFIQKTLRELFHDWFTPTERLSIAKILESLTPLGPGDIAKKFAKSVAKILESLTPLGPGNIAKKLAKKFAKKYCKNPGELDYTEAQDVLQIKSTVLCLCNDLVFPLVGPILTKFVMQISSIFEELRLQNVTLSLSKLWQKPWHRQYRCY